MSEKPNENVILFPKTVEFYQFELTRMLETERYGEAIQLLGFLLTCHHQDARIEEEWQALLEWLQTMFPEEVFTPGEEEEDLTEMELLRQHLSVKAKADSGYAEKLLALLQQPQSIENQLLALDQLAFIEHPAIDSKIIEWLTAHEQHPLIQYKGLQTLKLRGATGPITLDKHGESITVDVEDTPKSFEDFPSPMNEIMERFQEMSQISQPALFYYAQETWNEFLAYIYGTATYGQMLRLDRAGIDVWAAALHFVMLEKVFNSGTKDDVLELYGITNDLMFQWEQSYRIILQFASVFFSQSPVK
ncbi:hypothetical protein SAMN03159341_101189 [Paenibacillus sp. 1_12]|uniref:hypothetical protein n=1 Tax=Paenibacillus sp. 1_12 TaxID=1566278 RepID=UPI0008ED7419|nr:hypothetical protein [Paenibacillus sp. 1_12]SFK70676.1 hypothetical protein SAMN03159341_101189 [Paenibacillus sp. 1_12]